MAKGRLPTPFSIQASEDSTFGRANAKSGTGHLYSGHTVLKCQRHGGFCQGREAPQTSINIRENTLLSEILVRHTMQRERGPEKLGRLEIDQFIREHGSNIQRREFIAENLSDEKQHFCGKKNNLSEKTEVTSRGKREYQFMVEKIKISMERETIYQR